MLATGIELPDTIGAIARCRYVALARTNELIAESPADGAEHPKTLQSLCGLVTSSLEELKVAEEAHRVEQSVIEAKRASIGQRLWHYRQLFEYLPVAAFVTDIYAAIVEGESRGGRSLCRDARFLERKPLSDWQSRHVGGARHQ
jgi:hypothetical protein